jgi:ribonuclease J
VYVDGSSVGDITETSLKDRRILGTEGLISVLTVVDSATGKVVGGPEIHARGFLEDDSIFDEVVPRIVAALEDSGRSGVADTHQMQQIVRRVVGKWVNETHRRRPMIVPVVVEV